MKMTITLYTSQKWEDTKWIIRRSKSKNRQWNSQKDLQDKTGGVPEGLTSPTSATCRVTVKQQSTIVSCLSWKLAAKLICFCNLQSTGLGNNQKG